MPVPAKRRRGTKPTIAMDYKEFGEAEESEDKNKTNILKDELKSESATKAEVLEPELELSKEIKIFNRSIRWCGDKLEYEADSRHAEVIIQECEVQRCRAAKTPGVQEAVVDGVKKMESR